MIVAPQRERGGGTVHRHGVLRFVDRFQLEEHLPKQAAGVLAGAGLDLDDGEAVDGIDERDSGGAPLEGGGAQCACLRPASEPEERIGGIAPQEVAIDGLETRRPGHLDPLERDLDGCLALADEVEDGREVGVYAEQLVLVAGGLCQRPCLAEQGDRRSRIVAPAERDAKRRHRVGQLAATVRRTCLGDADRLAGQPFRLRERALEHLDLGEGREDRRPLDGRLLRHEGDGSLEGSNRAGRVAGRSPVAPEPFVEQPQCDAVPPLVEIAHDRLDEGGRPGRPAGCEGSLGGADLEGRHVRAAVTLTRPTAGRPGGQAIDRGQRKLDVTEGILRRVDRLGPTGRVDRRVLRLERRVGLIPVAGCGRRMGGKTSRQREVVTVTLARQQVRGHGPADELVAEVDGHPVELEHPVRDPFGEAGGEIGVEDAFPAARRVRRARRPAALGRQLVRGGHIGQLGGAQGAACRSEQPEDAPALRRSKPHAGDDQVFERARQRCAGQLAPGSEEFLGNERVAARALRHEHEGRTRWPLALDPFDQVRKVAPPQRIERQPRRLASRLDHLGDASRQWVRTGHVVGLVAH